jgi:hypothetical protein
MTACAVSYKQERKQQSNISGNIPGSTNQG